MRRTDFRTMLRITGETDCLCACSCVLFWTCSAVSQILCFQASLPVHGSLGAKAFDHLLPYQFDQVELVVLNTVADLWYDCIKQELECNPPAGGPIFWAYRHCYSRMLTRGPFLLKQRSTRRKLIDTRSWTASFLPFIRPAALSMRRQTCPLECSPKAKRQSI